MTDQNALFVMQTTARVVGDMETATLEQLAQLAKSIAFTPQQTLIAQTARALAQNIDRGNAKGRAIGNEAAQLLQAISMLMPDEDLDDADPSAVPAATKELFDALQQPPRQLEEIPGADRTEIRDPA